MLRLSATGCYGRAVAAINGQCSCIPVIRLCFLFVTYIYRFLLRLGSLRLCMAAIASEEMRPYRIDEGVLAWQLGDNHGELDHLVAPLSAI